MLARSELLLLALALALAGRVDAGGIVGGHKTEPHTRPYMVLLKLMGGRICGGFLLSEDFVLTAAHCSAMSYSVCLGVLDDRDKGFQVTSVAQTFPHEDYNATDYTSDIMLLKLSSKAILNQDVAPIALADEDDVSGTKSCLVSGWGKTNPADNFSSHVLNEVTVQLISNPECDKRRFYCSEGEKGPSFGDSGGPLVCDGKAYGVFSNEVKTGSNNPRILCFVKIPLYKTWIDSTMKKALN